MSSRPQAHVVYEFGPFRLDPGESRLLRDDVPVPLTPKAFETLVALVSRAGRLVEKVELLRELWPDAVVEESSLSQHVYLVRKALGEERGDVRYIETVPKRGYRFAAAVQQFDVAVGRDRLAPPAPAPDAVSAAPALAQALAAPAPPRARPGVARRRFGAALAAVVVVGVVARVALTPEPIAPTVAGRTSASGRPASLARASDTSAPLATDEAREASAPMPTRPEAYDAYARGLYFWNQRTPEAVQKAVRYFAAAVAHEPGFAPGHAALADAYALEAALRYGPVTPSEGYKRARAAAERALQLDPNLSAAHTVLALISREDGDRAAAEREFKLALRLNPRSATALQRYAQLLLDQGRLEAAIAVTARGVALAPASPALNANLCYFLYLGRDYERAKGYCDKAIELQPGLAQPLTTRALIEIQARHYARALALLEQAEAQADGIARLDLLDAKGYVYAVTGRRDLARVTLAELQRLTVGLDPRRITRLAIHVALGETERALDLLRSCVRDPATVVYEVALDPRYDELRRDPRFAEVVPAREPETGFAGGAGDVRTLSTLD